MKQLKVILALLSLAISTGAETFHATSNVEAGLNYGIEWRDANGNFQAFSYFQVIREPWEGGFNGYQYGAYTSNGEEVPITRVETGEPVEFPWPVTLTQLQSIDPAWTPFEVNNAWAYDYPNYVLNDGYPFRLFGYSGGDIWVDAQSEILIAFGVQPEWWTEPLLVLSVKGKGKKLGHSK
jgi:hypothetical protein